MNYKALIGMMAVVAAGAVAIAQPATKIPGAGTLTGPVQVPLVMGGKTIGTATLPQNTSVRVLEISGEKVAIQTSAATAWVDAKLVSIQTPPREEEPSRPAIIADGQEFPIKVGASTVSVTRLGSGPIGVIFFGHSGSEAMKKAILDGRQWYGDLPEKCSLFVWAYPKEAPFDQVDSTIAAYRGDTNAWLALPGIAESVTNQIARATGLRRFLIVGNSLGAGIVLWDYPKLAGNPNIDFLLISPTEAFMPDLKTLPTTLKRTMLLAIKGWKNGEVQMRPDPFLKGVEAWDWVAKNRDEEACDLITKSGPPAFVQERPGPTGKMTRFRFEPPQDFKSGHKIIGESINAELLGKLLRVKLGMAPKAILAEPPKQELGKWHP